MSNLRINGRTYRDIEKMTATELQGLAIKLAEEVRRLQKMRPSLANIGFIENQMKILQQRMPVIERLIESKKPKEKEVKK